MFLSIGPYLPRSILSLNSASPPKTVHVPLYIQVYASGHQGELECEHSLLVLKAEWGSEYRDDYKGICEDLYGDYYRGPLPHSPLSTSTTPSSLKDLQ